MPPGLSTPLHLAATLLALSAAVGLAVVAMSVIRARPVDGKRDLRPALPARGAAAALVAVGALAYAGGHALSGALVEGLGDAPAWLRALGLVAIVLGVLPPRLGGLLDDDDSALVVPGVIAAVLLPLPPVPAAYLAAAAGVIGGVRGLLGGSQGALVGAAIAAFGSAELLARQSLSVAALVTVAGAICLGSWLWQRSRTRLRAKFVTASVATLLGVVVLIAATLSGFGSGDLVEAELSRLRTRSAEVAREIAVRQPSEVVEEVEPYRFANGAFFGLDAAGEPDMVVEGVPDPGPQERISAVYEAAFRNSSDFLLVLDPAGAEYAIATFEGVPLGDEFRTALFDSATVDRLLDGEELAGELLVVDGIVHVIGGARLSTGSRDAPRPEEPARGVLVAGQALDAAWVEQVTGPQTGVIVEAGAQVSVASEELQDVAPQILLLLSAGRESAAVDVGGQVRYAAAVPLQGPNGDVAGRVVSVSSADAIAALERDQTRRLFVLAVLASALAGAAAALVSGRLVAPIRRLTAVAAAVREGELDVRADVESADEVGVLGRTFEEMTDSLGLQASQLREAATVQSRLRARLEALNESMGDALVAVDATGRIVTFNPAAEDLTGRAAGKAIGARLEEVLRGVGPEGVPAARAVGAAGSTEAVRVRLVLERPDGVRVPVAVTAAPVRDRGSEPGGRVLLLRDRTREAQLDRMKTEFLANVSHELRTPLTPIRGYAELLARRPVEGDDARAFAERILTSTGRLERIVGLIVEFAALDSGSVVFHREATAVAEIVDGALSGWRASHPDRSFTAELPDDLPPVLVDPALTRRCLDEVVDNAVKFSPGGEPVTVSALLEGTVGHPVVRVSVTDRGVGMDHGTLARVFGDFYQADATETRAFGGLGLGLALVRRIVDGLGGEVAMESEAGGGTTVHLRLPVHLPDGATLAVSPSRRVALPQGR